MKKIPGFAAEASVYRSAWLYREANSFDTDVYRGLHPALMDPWICGGLKRCCLRGGTQCCWAHVRNCQ